MEKNRLIWSWRDLIDEGSSGGWWWTVRSQQDTQDAPSLLLCTWHTTTQHTVFSAAWHCAALTVTLRRCHIINRIIEISGWILQFWDAVYEFRGTAFKLQKWKSLYEGNNTDLIIQYMYFIYCTSNQCFIISLLWSNIIHPGRWISVTPDTQMYLNTIFIISDITKWLRCSRTEIARSTNRGPFTLVMELSTTSPGLH